LSVSTSGARLQPGALADTTGVLPDIPVGIVNAGYPVSQRHAIELLDALHDREPDRYDKDMSTLQDLMDKDNVQRLPPNPLWTATGTKLVHNLLESPLNASTLPEGTWTFFAIPRKGHKSYEPAVGDKEAVQSVGYQYYRQLHDTLGDKEAADRMGAVFSALAHDNLQAIGQLDKDALTAFHDKKETFTFLLFALRTEYVANRTLTPLSCTNHVAIMNRLARELYPEDLSDVAAGQKHSQAWFYTHAHAGSGATKRSSDQDMPTPKRMMYSVAAVVQDGEISDS